MTTLSNSPIVCYYNGVTFPTETETLGIESKPVPDSSGRAVMYVVHRITLKAILAQANQALNQTTDATMASLRQRLTAYGGELHYENVGFGNLTVNVPPGGPGAGANGPAKDAVWGPKPEVLVWKPLGQIAAEVTWSVQVAIPECDTATYAFATLESVFRLEFDEDQSGYTRRVYSGHVRIPQTRATVGARTLQDQADRLRERINPPPVPGFRRIPGTFTLSEDKCRLDYVITDVEIGPNYPPPGVVEVSCSHTAGTDKAYGGVWFGTLRATYELARDTPRSVAFGYFLDTYEDRARRARNTPFRQGGIGLRRNEQVVYLRRFEVAEPEVYGKKGAAFSATYSFLSRLEDIVKAGGMWRPVPNSNWQRWAQSLANTAFNVRGNAKLRFSAGDDVIIDLCAQNQASLRAGAQPQDNAALKTVADRTINATPPPDVSWLAYESALWVEVVDEAVELKTLPQSSQDVSTLNATPGLGNPLPATLNAVDFGAIPGLGSSTLSTTGGSSTLQTVQGAARTASPGLGGPASAQITSVGTSVVQRRARPSLYVNLRGYAIRAGYLIAPPVLLSVGGAPVVPANRGPVFGHSIMASWFGLPIVGAWWHLRYLVTGAPQTLPIPPSPFLGY